MREVDVAALRADPRILWHEDVLRFADTDANGHINNTAFSVFCESGRVNYLYAVLGPTREPGRYFVLARMSITYHHELLFPGRVTSGTWISHVGRTSVRFGQILLDGSGRAVASSDAVTVSMERETRRPVALGEATREVALGRLRPDALPDSGTRAI